jgi:general secretion pathway protein E
MGQPSLDRDAVAPLAQAGEVRTTERLTDHLLAAGKITRGALERAMEAARESDERLETVLTRLGLISEHDLAQAIAAVLGLPLASERDYPAHPILPARLGARFLRDMRAIPLAEGEKLRIAMISPLDRYAVRALRFAVERPVDLVVAQPSSFEAAFRRLYGEESQDAQPASARTAEISDDVDRLNDSASDAPVIRLVNGLIARAVEAHASDIHVEPMENELVVRYRIDGVLQRVDAPPKALAAAIASRIKIMAKLDIAERRLGQDGRITLAVRGQDVDLRVATTPSVHGESIVLRILDKSQLALDFATLGFDDALIAGFRRLIRRPHGIVLVTGPTGSGKTTTLYAALQELNTVEHKILTIEDPIEYQIDGINQVQVKPQIGLTFSSTLRSFLRHDPDIILIGEIRDVETARIAVQASLTGHLILSTLHTNDAASAVTRLLDMGLEDYLLTATVTGVVAQRLVRRLCAHCREAQPADAELVRRLDLASLCATPLLYRATGCDSCRHTGYRGRTSIVEILPVNDAIRQAVMRKAQAGDLQALAMRSGMEPMHRHGFRKALVGETTIDEVLRVTLEAE